MYSFLSSVLIFSTISLSALGVNPGSKIKEVSSHQISLNERQPNKLVNQVFKDNILLNIAYLKGDVTKGQPVNWDKVEQPFSYQFSLEPGQTFAFHNVVLPQYGGKVVRTTNAHFNSLEGFKSDGYLMGDGVCHLASLMYWSAKDAGLEVLAPTNHNFMLINQVPKEDGVAIYAGNSASDANQNLYISNNTKGSVEFKFDYDGDNLKFSVLKDESNLSKELI